MSSNININMLPHVRYPVTDLVRSCLNPLAYFPHQLVSDTEISGQWDDDVDRLSPQQNGRLPLVSYFSDRRGQEFQQSDSQEDAIMFLKVRFTLFRVSHRVFKVLCTLRLPSTSCCSFWL